MARRVFDTQPSSEPVVLLLIGHPGTKFIEFSTKTKQFSYKEMGLKMPSGRWQPFCLAQYDNEAGIC